MSGVRRLKPGFRVYVELLMEDIRLNLNVSDAWNLGYLRSQASFIKAIHVISPLESEESFPSSMTCSLPEGRPQT